MKFLVEISDFKISLNMHEIGILSKNYTKSYFVLTFAAIMYRLTILYVREIIIMQTNEKYSGK